jgi:hypothetical protein
MSNNSTTASVDHTTRHDYSSLASALEDALRVQADLLEAIQDRNTLFLDADRLEFLARRAQQLMNAAHHHVVHLPGRQEQTHG